MARDKRTYRFLQDTRFGRKVLAESPEIAEIAEAVTRYVARRMIERERALADDEPGTGLTTAGARGFRIARAIGVFLLGMGCGILFLFMAAYIVASNLPAR
jgi:hypothetical protein